MGKVKITIKTINKEFLYFIVDEYSIIETDSIIEFEDKYGDIYSYSKEFLIERRPYRESS